MSRRSWFRRRVDICCGNIREFSYASLRMATNNFSVDRRIGNGGWGIVYKGLLSDGTVVAVKKLGRRAPSHTAREQYLSDLEVMSQIRHRNINRVIGYCMENDRLLIVSDYAVNGSLYDLLRDPERKEFSVGEWHRRAAICIGIARGLSYLHEDANLHVIHRDIKPANILLDTNYNPKISDFGVAKFFYDPSERKLPHEAEQIVGTFGYISPEYAYYGHYSEKVDVFSFGVVMLEIISGRGLIHGRDEYIVSWAIHRRDEYIVSWAAKLVESDRVMEIIDPVLTDVATDEAKSFIDVALLCLQSDPKLRPSMFQVMHMLYGAANPSILFIPRPDISAISDPHKGFSIGGSTATSDHEDEDEVESKILQDDGKVITENGSVEVNADSNTVVCAQGEVNHISFQSSTNNTTKRQVFEDEGGISTMQGECDLIYFNTEDSCWRQSVGSPDMLTTDHRSYSAYVSAASSFRSSTASTEYFEDEGEISILEYGGNARFTEMETTNSNAEIQVKGESKEREQSNTTRVSEVHVRHQQMKPGTILSGSSNLVERRSHTMVHKKLSGDLFPEPDYPSFRTRVYRRRGPVLTLHRP